MGLYIDQKLTWEEHTENICKKASAGIGATSLTTIYLPNRRWCSMFSKKIMHAWSRKTASGRTSGMRAPSAVFLDLKSALFS